MEDLLCKLNILVSDLLDDDHGINAAAYESLIDFCECLGHRPVHMDHTKCQDDRYYLPEGTIREKVHLSVVLYDDLDNADEKDNWDSFSWGDAEYTLVKASQLIAEINNPESLLSKELAALGECLIAFHG